jgi:hypothetical protein
MLLTDLTLDRNTPIIHVYMRMCVPAANTDVLAMMQSLFVLLCSSGLCVTTSLVW